MRLGEKCPCFGCTKRHIGCHCDCEPYLAHQEHRVAVRKHLQKDHDAIQFKVDGVRKARAVAHRHKPK